MSIWFQLPAKWRSVPSIRRRVIYVLIFHQLTVLITVFYSCYWWLFTVVPSDYQALLAISLPVIRELLGHLMSQLGEKCATAKIPSVDLNMANVVSLFHALFLASCVGSIATLLSTFILIGVDFSINLGYTFQIYYYYHKGNIKKSGEATMIVVLYEFIELFVPLTFLLCFLVSFYGGNRSSIGKYSSESKCLL